ncbi:MAG TPA: hypothetical protein VEW28_10715 [Candidatus Kapabacteria bacterium]|nr:hypothetical protein [Candidatus Kapabacteria bacterium]
MKKVIVRLLAVALFAGALYSCSPSVGNNGTLVTMDTTWSGNVTSTGGTRTYTLFLSCGCPFTMVIDSADTSHIIYTHSGLPQTITPQVITASKNGTLPSGKYTGFLALRIPPPSTDNIHLILRDTLIVP